MTGYRSLIHTKHLDELQDEILDGVVHVFPKPNSANAYMWYDNGIHAGHTGKELEIDDDDTDFFQYMSTSIDTLAIRDFCEMNRDCIVFGEFIDATKYCDGFGFYVIDVYRTAMHRYLTYDEYSSDFLLGAYPRLVRPIAVLDYPTKEDVLDCVRDYERNLPDGDVCEEITIKNYDLRDKYDNYKMENVVISEVCAKKHEPHDKAKTDINAVIPDFVKKFVTTDYMQKCKNNIENVTDECFDKANDKHVGMFMNLVVNDVMRKKFWNYFSKNLCTIDLRQLRNAIQARAREFLS